MKEFEVNGKKRPFCMGLAALMEYRDLAKGHHHEPEKLMYLIAWIGFTHGAKQKGLEADFTSSDVRSWLDTDFALACTITKDAIDLMDNFSKIMRPNGK